MQNNERSLFNNILKIALIDQLPDFVIAANADNTIAFWNQVAVTTFGYSDAQMVGALVSHLIDTDTFGDQKLEQLMQQLNDTGYWEGELPFIHHNGTRIWYFVRARRLVISETNSGVVFVGTSLIDHEIRHHRVQTALDYSQRELSNILSAVGDLVCSYNMTERNFDFISPSCQRLTGYTEFELMDNPVLFFDMIMPDYRAIVEESFETATVGDVVRLEYSILRKDGEERRVLNSLTPFEDEGHKRLICALTDTTAYHNLTELKSRMIRMASHDLNNPLSTAVGFFSLLASDLTDSFTDEQQMMVDNIHRSHQRMAKMLEELLDFEQIESRTHLNLEPVNLIEMVNSVLHEFSYQIQEQQHKISFLAPTEQMVVHADPVQIEHAVANYLSNAIKYTPEHGEIRISLSYYSDHVAVEFTDNGIGVPPSLHDKLFQSFFRAKQPGTDHIPGTGLGLSLVKSVVKQHRGDVYYRPEAQGSTFGFWLPL